MSNRSNRRARPPSTSPSPSPSPPPHTPSNKQNTVELQLLRKRIAQLEYELEERSPVPPPSTNDHESSQNVNRRRRQDDDKVRLPQLRVSPDKSSSAAPPAAAAMKGRHTRSRTIQQTGATANDSSISPKWGNPVHLPEPIPAAHLVLPSLTREKAPPDMFSGTVRDRPALSGSEHQVQDDPMVAGSAQMMILRALGISATEAVKRLNADNFISDAETRLVQNIVAGGNQAVINGIIRLEQCGRMRWAIEEFRQVVERAVGGRAKQGDGSGAATTAAGEGGATTATGATPPPPRAIAISGVAGSPMAAAVTSASNAALSPVSPVSIGSKRRTVSMCDDELDDELAKRRPSIVNTIPVAPGRNVHKVLVKIGRRLEALGNTGRKSIVIVGSGGYNPVTAMHVRMFYLARQFLEENTDYQVIGGLMSPSHCTFVRQKTRRTPREILPPRHRLSMTRAAVKHSSWMSVDPWEITRRRVMDYLSVLDHVSHILGVSFPGVPFRVVHLCGATSMVKVNPPALRQAGYGCLCVCRPLESERLLRQLGSRWNGVANIVEDTAILSRELEATSSQRVRAELMKGQPVHGMVGSQVAKHLVEHRIGEKLTGKLKWTERDKAFEWDDTPNPNDRYRPYMREPKKIVRPETDMPLQI